MRAHVLSVNVGAGMDEPWGGRLGRTAIRKVPVAGPVQVRALGLDGDEVVDTTYHGGVHKAVYAYAREDLDLWGRHLGAHLPSAFFGENLTTVGIDVNQAVLGEHWRVGTALLQPVEVRTPCVVFRNWMGVHGLDPAGWLKRFTEEGRPGPYLRVLEEGVLQAGDEIVVEHRPEHGVTVATMFAALMTDPSRLLELLEVEGLSEQVYAAARRQAGR